MATKRVKKASPLSAAEEQRLSFVTKRWSPIPPAQMIDWQPTLQLNNRGLVQLRCIKFFATYDKGRPWNCWEWRLTPEHQKA